jgi:hypothetical protein
MTTYTALDIRPNGEHVLSAGLTLAQVLTYVAPAGTWALTFRQES